MGNTYLHSLNDDHLAADAVRSLARLRERAFELMTETLRSWPHPPAHAAVFGSAARREEAADSDIDVPLVPTSDAEEWSRQQAVSRFIDTISKATGNDVRVLELTEGELRDPANEALRHELQKDAIVLLGRRSRLEAMSA